MPDTHVAEAKLGRYTKAILRPTAHVLLVLSLIGGAGLAQAQDAQVDDAAEVMPEAAGEEAPQEDAAAEESPAPVSLDPPMDLDMEMEPLAIPTLQIFGSPEAVSSTPGSGYYLGSEEIRQQNYDDINRALRRVPGVYLREEDGFGLFPNISLRGADHGRSSKVTVMEDGILQAPAPYSAPAAYYTPTVGRMDAIEILKGSSQIRFGPHITGGAINYISTPIPYERSGYLNLMYGEYNELRTHLHFGDTIDLERGGRIGYLLEAYFRRSDGFQHFNPHTLDFRGGDTGFRNIEPMLKLMWEPDTDIYQRLELKYGYTNQDADATYLGLSEGDFRRDPYRRYPATRFDNIATEQHRSYLQHYAQFTPVFSLETTVYYNEFSRNWTKLQSVNGMNLSRALAAQRADYYLLRGQSRGQFNVRANNRSYYAWGIQVTPRFDFDLGNTRHELEIGIRYHNDRIRRFQWSHDYTQSYGGTVVWRADNLGGSAGNRMQETYALALYIQDKITIDNWTFVPGLRFEHLDHRYIDYGQNPFNIVVERDKGSMNLVGGGLGVTYDWTDNFQTYGGIHRGFSPPGPRAHLRDGLKEETSTTYELGLRHQIPEHQFQAEVTGFYTRYKDLIAIDNVGGAGSVAGTTENVGRVNTRGIELMVQYDPGLAYGWGFSTPTFASYTYTDAKLASNTGGDPESIFSGGVRGNRVPYVPKNQLTVGTGVDFKQVGVFVTGNYVSEQFGTASNTARQRQPDGTPDARFGKIESRFLVDLSGEYRFAEGAKFYAGVQNLFNKEYMASRLPHGPRPGKPRFAYLGFEYEF